MALRKTLAGDAQRLHELLDRLLDSEDALVVLFDGDRAINYVSGLGVSPCQLELLGLEIERLVRTAGGLKTSPEVPAPAVTSSRFGGDSSTLPAATAGLFP